VVPSLLRSLFVLRGPWQLFHVAWLSLLAAASVVSMSAVIEANAQARYGTEAVWSSEPPLVHNWLQLAALLALALPVPLVWLVLRRAEGVPGSSAAWTVALAAGLAVGVLVLVLMQIVQELLLPDAVLLSDLLPFRQQLHRLLASAGLPRANALGPA